MNRWIVGLASLLMFAPVLPQSYAQNWPAKPVRLVVSTGPGISTDIVARLLADRLSRAIGQQFVVENIAGAAGNIAAQAVARAAPDGYTLLFTGGGTLVTNAYAFKSLPFNAAQDFAPVARITRASGFLVAVTAALPVTSIPEFVALVKSQPGKFSYATDVSNIYVQLAARMFNREAGIDITEIPYKSTPQAIQDTVAGRTQMIIGAASELQPVLKSGKLRLLAVTASGRNAAFPGVPSLVEFYPALQMDPVGFTVVAPAATAAEILQNLNRVIIAILKEPQFVQQLASQGLGAAAPGSPEDTAEELREQRQRWGKIFKDLGIQPQ